MPARVAFPALLPYLAACMGLGFWVAVLRALFPAHRRSWGCFWLDLTAAFGALLLAQGYAARSAAAGELRWYLAAALLAGGTAGTRLLAQPFARLRSRAYRALVAPLRRAAERTGAFVCRTCAPKMKKIRSRVRKNTKKQMQTGQKVMYNYKVL